MTQVLLLGNTSLVATGLEERLRSNAIDVVTFRRGPVGEHGYTVTGSVFQLRSNPYLQRRFDAVVNFILLKDESLDQNVKFVNELASYIEDRQIPHLIHVSSISSYSDKTSLIIEGSPTESDPRKKGSYGSLKVATDLAVIERAHGRFALTLIRPGFVLADGLASPIVGMGIRIPANGLLVLGSANDTVPVIRRTDVHEAIVRILTRGPRSDLPVTLLADRNSPTRAEYLQWCSRELGISTWTLSFPRWVWLAAGVAGKAAAPMLPKTIDPWRVATSLTRIRRFDASLTEASLGLHIAVDWKSELRSAMAGQGSNVALPATAVQHSTPPKGRISIVGFGGIVKQKHLPALERLKHAGPIDAYDINAPLTWHNVKIQGIPSQRINDAILTIVASPGPAHVEAIPLLPQDHSAILIEKPLCMSGKELDDWIQFAGTRPGFTGVIHNYRFKSNVQGLLSLLKKRHPGRLLHAHVCFQSPPVSFDVSWRRAERKARTLLMDYGLHFLDVATMFSRDQWLPSCVRYTVNHRGETDFITGTLQSSAYDVSFVLRQGFLPREASVRFVFQNYNATLSFFPDVLSVMMSGDDFGVQFGRAGALLRGMVSKVRDKLSSGDNDESHMSILGMAMQQPHSIEDLTVVQLAPFYRAVFALADMVYDERRQLA
jgi:nucleoside-diphosphate-sugar epimerase